MAIPRECHAQGRPKVFAEQTTSFRPPSSHLATRTGPELELKTCVQID